MIRVGFSLSVGFLGSVNYYRNLLSALMSVPDRKIEPVLFLGNRAGTGVASEFPCIEIIRSDIFDQFAPRWFLRKGSQQILSWDPLLQQLLKQHRIALLSHSDIIGRGADLPTICWIPDFQHVHLPEMFKRSERLFRNRDFRQQCRHATLMVVSSHDAQKDLNAFAPYALEKSRVLQFVAQPKVSNSTPSRAELEQKYGFRGRYFHVPNQFWAHKDHGAILEALARLKRQGGHAQVIATGATEDYRRPSYFPDLMRRADELGVVNEFKVLGQVPYPDLVGLLINSIALINPSRAEGWSTSVEEAKSLGKRIILSSLPVHVEQAPPDGVYFPVGDADALADAMRAVLNQFHEEVEEARMARAQMALPGRIEAFARRYEAIVDDAIQRFGREPGRAAQPPTVR